MRILFDNARVYTGETELQQAFIIENSRFAFAGSRAEALALPYDETVDLDGAFVCPGFIDSHMHLLSYGQSLSQAPLHRHTDSMEALVECLRQTPPGRGGWILGRGWNQDYFADVRRMPDRRDLDRVSLTHPVCAVRACGHALALNTKALEMLGVTADTPQPEGGAIGMEDGLPNGLFFDNAMDLVYAAIPAPDKEDVKQMLRAACRALNSQGITGCHSDDYCVFQNLPWQVVNDAYRELEAEGALTVRVYEQANFTAATELAAYMDAGCVTGAGTDFFRIGPLKMLGDGALGARTAYLSRPYTDDPSTRGLSVFTPETFDEMIALAHCRGMQAAVHCIGDACLDLVLDSFEKAMTAHPRPDCRHGIVHCQITRPDQLERIARLGLHIYAQSLFLDYDIRMVRRRVGTLADSSYSWKTLMEKGCTVSNGSDCPVELPRALAGIQCAVTRCTLDGEGPYLPRQAFTVREALDSFTLASARASFEEDRKGRIAPGYWADFTVLGADPFQTDPAGLKDIPVWQTWVNGRRVYG